MNNLYRDSLQLMETLLKYRQEPITRELETVRHKHSMLHSDVLTLIYHFAKTCAGSVLEIGSYLGGATIAAAWGIRDSGRRRPLVSIEVGGRCEHPRLPTKNILRDLKKNVAKRGVSELVTLVEGHSRDEKVIATVRQKLEPGSVGLLIIDADAGLKNNIGHYGGLLSENCWAVIDDYYAPGPGSKDVFVRPQINALVDAGQLETLGFYGWATWVGRWRGSERTGLYAASSGVRSTGAEIP